MTVRSRIGRRLLAMYQATERRVYRRGFIGVCIGILLVIGWPVLVGVAARLSYNGKSYTVAQRLWRLQAVTSWYDKDVPPANAGLAYYQLSMLTPAVDQLEHALSIAHPARQCQIRWNLAIVLATRADQQVQANPNDAVGDYARAINVLNNDDCLSRPEYRDKFQQYITALTTKMEALIAQIAAQHKRPEDANKKQEQTKTPSDSEKAEKAIKQQNDYQHSMTYDRYEKQSDEEKDKAYSESVW